MKSVKCKVGADCEWPIQPAPCSLPTPQPPAQRSAPAPSFSVTPAPRSAPLHQIFGLLRSAFHTARILSHALLRTIKPNTVACTTLRTNIALNYAIKTAR